jgi:TP901 family phage tail tape measure protein
MPDDVTSLQIRILSDEVDQARRRLGALEDASRRVDRQNDRTSRSATNMGGMMEKGYRRAATAAIALGTGLLAVGVGVKSATSDWLAYDKAMKEVQSIAGYTQASLAGVRREALLLSSAIGVNATESAKGLYQAISAGIPKDNALSFMGVASKSAIAGVATVESSVDALTAVINAYGMSASDAEMVSDKLFVTVKKGITTFPELAQNLAKATGPAEALGVSLDELLSQVIAITNKKVPTAEAFTQIKATIQAMNDPSQEMITALKDMGFETSRAAIAQLGYGEVLNRVRKFYEGNDAALVKALRSSEAYNGVLATTGRNAKVAASALGDLETATGSMAGAYAENAKTLENALTSLKSSSVLLVEQMEASLGIIAAFSEALRGAAMLMNMVSTGQSSLLSTNGQIAQAGNSAVGFAQTTAEIKKLNEELALIRANDRPGDPRSLLGAVQAGSIQKKIVELTDNLSKMGPETVKLGQTMVDAEKLNKAFAAGAIDIHEYHFAMKGLQGTQEGIAAAATEQLRLEEEKRKAEKAEQKALLDKKAAADKILQQQEEELKNMKEAGKMATDLATTEKERIEKKQDLIRKSIEAGVTDKVVGEKALKILQDQIALLDQRNAKVGGSGGGGGGGGSSIAGALASSFEDSLPELSGGSYGESEFDRLKKEEEELKASYDRRRVAIVNATQITEEQKQSLLARTGAQYTNMQRQMELERNRMMVAGMGELFGNLSQIAGAFGKRGAKAAKALAIVQATAKMYESATSAYASAAAIPVYGFVAAPIAAGAALAAGAVNIANIKAQDENIAAYEHGGMIPAGRKGLVGEAGPEIVMGPAMVTSARNTADRNYSSGREPVQQNVEIRVFNYGSEKVDVKSSQVGERKMVDLIIGKAKEGVAEDIRKGGTGISKALESTYNMGRGRSS